MLENSASRWRAELSAGVDSNLFFRYYCRYFCMSWLVCQFVAVCWADGRTLGMCFPVRPDGTAVVAAGAGELLPPPPPLVLLKPIASKQLGLRSSEVAMVWMPGFSEL